MRFDQHKWWLFCNFVALDARLPLVNPYLNKDALTRHGINFAVAGSTALSSELLSKKKISSLLTNSSLDLQLDWMFSHFNSICYDPKGLLFFLFLFLLL